MRSPDATAASPRAVPVVILAGGLGTRLAEETEIKPKPMVEVGERPILWHIMKHFAHHGLREFYVALGYKGEVIKQFFLDYHTVAGSMTVGTATGGVERHAREADDWLVHLMETGQHSNTGGRIARLRPSLSAGTFIVTYGDGVSDVDVPALLAFHRAHGKLATVTAVRPPARYGGVLFEDDLVASFAERPQSGDGWINGGYLVFEPGLFEYLGGDAVSLEGDVLPRLAAGRQLAAFRHDGFWQCMDTQRDKRHLEALWQTGKAPWRVWP